MRLLVVRSADELGVKGRSNIVIKIGNEIRERAIRDVDAVLVIGSKVKISSALPPVLALHGIPLAIIAKDHVAITINPIVMRYNNYRRLQYQLPKSEALKIALTYIEAKVYGMANILKYRKSATLELPPPPPPVEDDEAYEKNIRVWEALCSSTLWQQLTSLIRIDRLEELKSKYNFPGRKPQHPDPFNKALSVMYGVLYSLATKALIAAGLDPTYGFLHRSRYSTPLTFDYVEMFKPVAIEATIDLVNREGLPALSEDGELTRDGVNAAIKYMYQYLTLKHKDTGRSVYQQIFLKAFRLAKYLEGESRLEALTFTWDRRQYRQPKKAKTAKQAPNS